ncbi:unnamed protein product [Bursaphelenchus xylophilus]|uniref:leucine--tRNA ligase n=1 Tax=Bursaphelenchus xylophilus TaxID=6326 RepID=A0A1I7RV97_BURXY|nr:unnamed protein product [Bursaphelenchus xylophilus]CAG9086576.1 unnamed protein product [Bursaphelenchus xylophilus]
MLKKCLSLTSSRVQGIRHKSKSCYILPMFPYPSGHLHLGHMRVYTISDVMARYFRLNGFDIIHPIGWDSFGLPAENAAIERGLDPAEWTQNNIREMKAQLLKIGVQFDWDRELSTCDPDYFKWTQNIFVKLYNSGLIHRRNSPVYWDPVDKTVLASEQIDSSGRAWRSGALAEKRNLKQWAVETPRYAKRLLDGLEKLSIQSRSWEEVAAIQANWIGKCDVYRFMLPVNGGDPDEYFDLRIQDPTELCRAEFILVLPSHPLAEPGKTGRYISKKTVRNIVTGSNLPVFVLDENAELNSVEPFFLESRLGYSRKCEVDKKLAKTYGLESIDNQVVMSTDGILSVAEKEGAGGYITSRKQSDWVVSRQRGWGTPIPMALNDQGEYRPVPESLLPVLGSMRGQSIDGIGKIETDTLDTFFDSSWYYLRYLDPHNQNCLADLRKQSEFMPVHLYIGGVEHADCHVFFARFISHFLHDIGLATTPEPFAQLLPQGVVKGLTFVQNDGKYLAEDQVEKAGEGYVAKDTRQSVKAVYEKMSKSKGNGTDPMDVINEFGVDMTRVQLLRSAAPRSDLNWSTKDLKGLTKWIERVRWLVSTYVSYRREQPNADAKNDPKTDEYCREAYNYHILNVSLCLELLHLHNTSIMNLQGLTSTLRKMDPEEIGTSKEAERCINALVVMLQVAAPNIANELWEELKSVEFYDESIREKEKTVSEQKWPEIDKDAKIEFIVRVLGTTCVKASVPRTEIESSSTTELLKTAKSEYHKEFFQMMQKEFNLDVNESRVRRRNGLYVCLDLEMPEKFTGADLDSILKRWLEHKSELRKAEKKVKKQKKAQG